MSVRVCEDCAGPLAKPRSSARTCRPCYFTRRRSRAAAGIDRARFDARVDRSGGPTACWPWMGRRDADGYGRIDDPILGQPVMAHRVAYANENGPIPAGLWILHRCDNPPCCNPAHHFPGTVADNNADMKAKGRYRLDGLISTRGSRAVAAAANGDASAALGWLPVDSGPASRGPAARVGAERR